jgi:predicted permease
VNHLLAILTALVPLFGLIVLGTFLARWRFPGAEFWQRLERLIYFILFPALLVESLASAPLDPSRISPLLLAVVMTLCAGSGLVFAIQPLLRLDGPALSSLYQGSIRFNTYLGIAIVMAVFEPSTLAVMALVIGLMIPLVNLGCVLVLSRFAGGDGSAVGMFKSLTRNPLILGCLVGLGLNLSGLGLHPSFALGFSFAGEAAVPLGLMCVGAGLSLQRLNADRSALVGAGMIKLLLLPLLAAMIAHVVGLGIQETQVLVVFAALPTATSAYILARQMGGDHGLIAGMLTVQTAAAVISLPIVLALLASHGS